MIWHLGMPKISINPLCWVTWKWKWSHSVVSNSLQPHVLLPTRLLCPWDSPGKNTGVGCHFLLQGIFPTQESNTGLPHCRQTQADTLTSEPPGSPDWVIWVVSNSVTPWTLACQAPLSLGILQARILEWVAMPSSGGSSWSRDWPWIS